jgi:hypothetical protein
MLQDPTNFFLQLGIFPRSCSIVPSDLERKRRTALVQLSFDSAHRAGDGSFIFRSSSAIVVSLISCPYRDTCEGLIHMNRIVLLSVGAKP